MIEEENNNENRNEINQIHGQERLDIKQYTPNRDQERPVTITAPYIWSGFPLSDRFWYAFCCRSKCCTDFNSIIYYSQQCLAQNCMRDPKLEVSDKILQLSILRTGTLEIERIVVHPYVKISLVNLKTGRYLQKYNFNTPAVSKTERNFIIQHNKAQNRLDFQTSPLDIIAPVATRPYDLREKGEAYAEWNEDFYFNEDAAYLLDSNVIILFELMDFNLDYSMNAIDECKFPMAWGYLKPVGFSQTYMGKHKIQLFKYKFKRGIELNNLKQKNLDFLRTPDVLYELDWIKKEKYQTFLQIQLGLTTRPTEDEMKKAYFYDKFIYSIFCPEGDKIDYEMIKFQQKKLKSEVEVPSEQKIDKLMKLRRNPEESCRVPNKLMFKFPTAKLGCLTHEFSHNGRYLAAACTEITSETTIKIFNVEEGVLMYYFKGHHQLIHHFSWSFDDLLLISSSADNLVSIWKIPKEENKDLNNLEYLDNEYKFKLTSISHPAYVYSTAIYPENSKTLMIIATACFDGIVRFFAINLDYNNNNSTYSLIKTTFLEDIQIQISQGMHDVEYFSKLSEINKKKVRDSKKEDLLGKTALDHRHPNSIVFDISGQLYIGDSLGYIHIWELKIVAGRVSCNKIRTKTHKDLKFDTINKLLIYPSITSKRLIVHSRDNCIRVIDMSHEEIFIAKSFFGLRCNRTNIKSTVSPDGQYLLSGSENGEPIIWDYDSSLTIGTKKFECGVIDSINDVSWNNCYNMTALSAFGQEYPLLIHVFEKKAAILGKKDLKIKTDQPINTNTSQPNVPNDLARNTKIETLIEEEADVEEDHQLNPVHPDMSQFSIGYKTLAEKNLQSK